MIILTLAVKFVKCIFVKARDRELSEVIDWDFPDNRNVLHIACDKPLQNMYSEKRCQYSELNCQLVTIYTCSSLQSSSLVQNN